MRNQALFRRNQVRPIKIYLLVEVLHYDGGITTVRNSTLGIGCNFYYPHSRKSVVSPERQSKRYARADAEIPGASGDDRGGEAGPAPTTSSGVRWKAEDDALRGTMKDKDVATRNGRTESAVSERRYVLGVPALIKRSPHGKSIHGTPAKDRLLGTMPDTALARRLACTLAMARFPR